MNPVEKKPLPEITYTPENVDGACMSGKGMTKGEAAKIAAWVKDQKAANKTTHQIE